MATINDCFLEVYTPPRLVSSDIKVLSHGNVSSQLKSRQTIRLTQDEMIELSKDQNFWFYESDAGYYHNLGSMPKMFDDSDFENIQDGYGISEYIGVHEKYLPSMEYLQYCIINNNDVLMNVYDAYNLYNIAKRHPILRNKVVGELLIRHHDDYNQDLPEFEFDVPEVIKQTKFATKKYEPEVFVSCFKDPVHILSVNLPYSFYAYQPLPHSTYTWDIDTKEHKFGYMSGTEFNAMLNNIAANGIRKPLFMRMDGEVLSSADDETTMILFIAKILKLSYIPVNIYLCNEDIGKNYLIDAVINNTENKTPIYKNIGFMKNIFEPYFIVHNPGTEITNLNINQYSVFSSDNNIIIRYRNKDITDEASNNINAQIVNAHNEMRDKEIEAINNDVNTIINKLLGK